MGQRKKIPEYIRIPAILLLGAEKPEWKSRYSGMRIALKQTLARIILTILIIILMISSATGILLSFLHAKVGRERLVYFIVSYHIVLNLYFVK